MEDAYPLHWPAGRGRTSRRSEGPFDLAGKSPHSVMEQLRREVRLMSGKQLVISTNMPTRQDGLPYANARQPDDPGVAVYFERSGDRVCFACDQYDRVWKNMRAIAKTIEAMRGIERWGSKEMLDRAFTGFAALPPPIEMSGPDSLPRPWHDILGVASGAPWSEIRTAYRDKMREASDTEKTAINLAYEQAKKSHQA